MNKIAFLLLSFISACSFFSLETGTLCGSNLSPVQHRNLIICVSQDYYSEDGIRIPVSLPDALEIAAELDMMIPTVSMVDDIYRQADIQLEPIPMAPGPLMTSRSYYVQHNNIINEQLEDLQTEGLLIAGHKKDIVLPTRNSRVAIYGWHTSDEHPIQPYSTVHGEYYFDYSHGLRLISKTAFDSNGNEVDLEEYLRR